MAKNKQARRGVKKKNLHQEVLGRVMPVLRNSMLHKSIITSLILTVMFIGWQKFSVVEVLAIEVVKIEGEFNYLSRDNLQKQALPHVQGGFFSVDLKAIRQALIGLPWVEDVSIRRQWPNELSVRVMEKQPVAYWGDDALLSLRSDLFKPENINNDLNLPRIYGPNGQHVLMLQELSRMQAWLAGTSLVINKIMQDARRSWTLYMDTGLELRLGREKQHERMHRFVDVFKKRLLINKQKIRHIDMRYTNGFAVAWQKQEA